MNIKTTKKTLSFVLITTVLSLISLTAIAVKDAPAISGYGIQSSGSSPGVWCKGIIKDVWVQKNGSVYIHGDWRGTHTAICNINSSWKNVLPAVCKNWLGIAQQAHATRTEVIVRYGKTSSCKTIPHYGNAPSPDYIMLRAS